MGGGMISIAGNGDVGRGLQADAAAAGLTVEQIRGILNTVAPNRNLISGSNVEQLTGEVDEGVVFKQQIFHHRIFAGLTENTGVDIDQRGPVAHVAAFKGIAADRQSIHTSSLRPKPLRNVCDYQDGRSLSAEKFIAGYQSLTSLRQDSRARFS